MLAFKCMFMGTMVAAACLAIWWLPASAMAGSLARPGGLRRGRHVSIVHRFRRVGMLLYSLPVVTTAWVAVIVVMLPWGIAAGTWPSLGWGYYDAAVRRRNWRLRARRLPSGGRRPPKKYLAERGPNPLRTLHCCFHVAVDAATGRLALLSRADARRPARRRPYCHRLGAAASSPTLEAADRSRLVVVRCDRDAALHARTARGG